MRLLSSFLSYYQLKLKLSRSYCFYGNLLCLKMVTMWSLEWLSSVLIPRLEHQLINNGSYDNLSKLSLELSWKLLPAHTCTVCLLPIHSQKLCFKNFNEIYFLITKITCSTYPLPIAKQSVLNFQSECKETQFRK